MSQPDRLTLGSLHGLVANLSSLRANVLAFVCGVLTLFAFAPFHFWPVYLLSLSLLVWLMDGARLKPKWRRAVFMRGWLFGAGFTISSMHWMAAPFLIDPAKHLMFIWMPLILLPAGLGLFFGGATVLAGHLWDRTPGRVFILAASIGVFEWFRGTLFGGFPWNWPGTIWEPGSAMSQLASLGGVYGLSIVTLMIACAPAALADFRKDGTAFSRIIPVLICVVVFGFGWGWGSQRLTHPLSERTLDIRLVDVGVPLTEKYPPTRDEQIQAILNVRGAYLEAMGDDFPDEPRLVIWPEAALPNFLLQDPDTLDSVALRLGNRVLIAGTARIDRYVQPGPEYFNSLAILTANSRMRGPLAIYDKNRLVPFGELAAADFIPFGHDISGILPDAMQQLAEDGFTPGTPPRPLELPSGETFLPLICYEALFPYLVRQNLADADFLVNISIDSWFGGKIGPDQHFAQASYRSIESGRPMVRVANLGETGLIGPYGREIDGNRKVSELNGWPVKVVDVALPLTKIDTTYTRIGNTLALVLLVLLFLSKTLFRRTYS